MHIEQSKQPQKKKKRLEDKLLKGKWLLEKVPNQFSGGQPSRKKNKISILCQSIHRHKCNMELRLTPRVTKFLEKEQKSISVTIW